MFDLSHDVGRAFSLFSRVARCPPCLLSAMSESSPCIKNSFPKTYVLCAVCSLRRVCFLERERSFGVMSLCVASSWLVVFGVEGSAGSGEPVESRRSLCHEQDCNCMANFCGCVRCLLLRFYFCFDCLVFFNNFNIIKEHVAYL